MLMSLFPLINCQFCLTIKNEAMYNTKHRFLSEEDREMMSINAELYDLFTIEELEQRLQTSPAPIWVCATDNNNCNPICTTVGSTCMPIIGCQPVVGR